MHAVRDQLMQQSLLCIESLAQGRKSSRRQGFVCQAFIHFHYRAAYSVMFGLQKVVAQFHVTVQLMLYNFKHSTRMKQKTFYCHFQTCYIDNICTFSSHRFFFVTFRFVRICLTGLKLAYFCCTAVEDEVIWLTV